MASIEPTDDMAAADEPAAPGTYPDDTVAYLEEVWGEGFLSPGGAAEVDRIVGDVDLRDCTVLDLGCGSGGGVLHLAGAHGARQVVGADITGSLLDLGSARAAAAGVADRTAFTLIAPGAPLPFPDGSFDAVFSKDALIHAEDKAAMFAEVHRVLRPGGRLLYGDWLRGHGADLDPAVRALEEAVGGAHMASLPDTVHLLEGAGFAIDAVEDRTDWYHAESQRELARFSEPPAAGGDASDSPERDPHMDFWELLPDATRDGVLRPAHIRAHRPGRSA